MVLRSYGLALLWSCALLSQTRSGLPQPALFRSCALFRSRALLVDGALFWSRALFWSCALLVLRSSSRLPGMAYHTPRSLSETYLCRAIAEIGVFINCSQAGFLLAFNGRYPVPRSSIKPRQESYAPRHPHPTSYSPPISL